MKQRANRQQGFAAIMAVFLIAGLAAMGGYMLTFSNTQHLTSMQDVLGSKVYWAARGGLEWGVTQASASNCPAGTLTLEGFNVTVTCASQTYSDDGSKTILRITSTAASAGSVGSVGYIERSVSGSIEF